MNFTVERESPSGVRLQLWGFWIVISHQGRVHCVLDHYVESTRMSRRHKYRPLVRYSRIDRRENSIELRDLPQPPDVYNEAFQKVADSIQVVVWPGDITSARPFGGTRDA